MKLRITPGEWPVEYDNYGNGGFSEWYDVGPAKVHIPRDGREGAKTDALAISRVPEMLAWVHSLLYQGGPPYILCHRDREEGHALLKGLVEGS